MNLFKSTLFASALLALSTACGTFTPGASYRATVVEFDAAPEQVKLAVQTVIEERGWSVVREDSNLLEALSPVESLLADLPVRERWLFVINGSTVTVTRVFEAHFADDEKWMSSADVCDTYDYTRETEVAMDMQALMERFPSAPLAMRSN